MINLTIDGINISVPEGTTILEAARTAGIDIPTLCFLKEINECVTAEGAVEIIDKSEYTDIYNILCDKCKQRAEQYLHNEVEVEFYMFRMDKSLLGKSQRADWLMEEFKWLIL